jgi:general secretion pathway protein H
MALPVVKACIQTSAHGILISRIYATGVQRLQRAENGFTLLELLVVIVIVSILFTFTTLAIRSSSPEDLIQTEAQRLDRLLQLAQEEAILKGEQFGLEFKPDGYRFMRYVDYVWQPMENDRQLRQRKLPLDMKIEVEIEQVEILLETDKQTSQSDDSNEEKDKEKIKPQVFLLSSGEITPEFSARFVIPGIETSYIVSANAEGEHKAEISEL